MNKKTIDVPAGIKYISEWAKHQDSPFSIPDHPCIIDKGLTGCGFTEYCINPQYNSENVILCSPRRILLENKEEQNPHSLYVRNEYENTLGVDKDLNGDKEVVDVEHDQNAVKIYHMNLKSQIGDYISQCMLSREPAKILVTYDSFRIVKEELEDRGILGLFNIVVDEFQSIFTDAIFKGDIGIEFLDHVSNIQKICFVSATPTMDKYLSRIPFLNTLPYYQMDWGSLDPLRVMKPELSVSAFSGQSLMAVANRAIQDYLAGDFQEDYRQRPDGTIETIKSKELVIYVNSVKNICDIIRKSELRPEQVNILCARTSDNEKKIKISLRPMSKLYGKYEIGKVPTRNEPRKMFTFCTRTVYLGADFYSDNARTMILSDANVKCLAVDITLDLPQIMGRQRLDSNPWKNRAELHAKLIKSKANEEEYRKEIAKKINRTNGVIQNHIDITADDRKLIYIDQITELGRRLCYKYDYVSVKKHTCAAPVPCFNDLVMLAEERSFEIQQKEYTDRFTVINNASIGHTVTTSSIKVHEFLNKFENLRNFRDKLKLLCEDYHGQLCEEELDFVFKQIPKHFRGYYLILGPEKIKSTCYNVTLLNKHVYDILHPFKPEDLDAEIYSNFSEGQRVSSSDAKNILKIIYQNNDVQKTANATDLNNYFETRETKMTLPDKSKSRGFKLVKKLR